MLLLQEGVTAKGKPLEHSLMVKDHYAALRFVLEAVQKKTTLTVQFIQEINAKVMRSTGSIHQTVLGVVDETQDEFYKGNVRAGGIIFLIETFGGKRHYYYYVSSIVDFRIRVEKILKKFDSINLTFFFKEDTEWNFIKTYPVRCYER